ncbi:hypothetical protein LOK49_LG15G00588 [Camellia lanceoleosa]|uniref:Uncharacterized protein n=1 Tax=Camellia lanceoleosa TaxID=1840588 RepID=A0ACC0F350_9ERIC|nr:hypothetical protein LOK49_LG15G00588 [Camellia lanceoleosa]
MKASGAYIYHTSTMILIFLIITTTTTTKPLLAYRSLKEGDQAMVSHGGGAVSAEDSKGYRPLEGDQVTARRVPVSSTLARGKGWPPSPSGCTYIGNIPAPPGNGCGRSCHHV